MSRNGQHRIPIIHLWGCVIVPLQGDITDEQMEQLGHEVLQRLRQRPVRGLVVDVSGLWLLDSHLCAALGQLAASASLMGTPGILCGLSPDVAMTLHEMGIALRGLKTALGLEHALEALGLCPERPPPEEDFDDPA